MAFCLFAISDLMGTRLTDWVLLNEIPLQIHKDFMVA
jgi:hypothetical protein